MANSPAETLSQAMSALPPKADIKSTSVYSKAHECPLWVKSRHGRPFKRCPLYPQ